MEGASDVAARLEQRIRILITDIRNLPSDKAVEGHARGVWQRHLYKKQISHKSRVAQYSICNSVTGRDTHVKIEKGKAVCELLVFEK